MDLERPDRRARRSRRRRALLGAGLALGAGLSTLAAGAAVVVEEYRPAASDAGADLRPDDLLLSYCLAPCASAGAAADDGELPNPFTLEALALEEGPRRGVRWVRERGGVRESVGLAPGPWRIRGRPELADDLLALYRAGEAAPGGQDPAREEGAGLASWRALAEELRQRGRPLDAAWLLSRLAAAERERPAAALEALGAALVLAQEAGDGVAAALLQAEIGQARERAGDPAGAIAAWEEALAGWRRRTPRGLGAAAALHRLGRLLRGERRLEEARPRVEEALAIRASLAPESLEEAASRNELGAVELSTGRLDAAEEQFRRSLAIRERRAPESPEAALTVNNLALVAELRDDLAAAVALYDRAIALQRRLPGAHEDLAWTLSNRGIVASKQGDLEAAEALWEESLRLLAEVPTAALDRALIGNNLGILALQRGDLPAAEQRFGAAFEVRRRLAPGSLDLAASLQNLALVAVERGRLAEAEALHLEALAIKEQVTPESLGVALALNNLGVVAWRRHDGAAARSYLERAAGIQRRLAPQSLELARSLGNLGLLARSEGALARAEELYREALALQRAAAPRGQDAARTLYQLGNLALERRDLEAAGRHHREALAERRRLAGGTLAEAESLGALGRVRLAAGASEEARSLLDQALGMARRWAPDGVEEVEIGLSLADLDGSAGRPAEAAAAFGAALAALERQLGGVGGSDPARTGFLARFGGAYHDFVALLVDLGRAAEAFAASERYRTRALFSLFADRDLAHGTEVPAELDRERRRLAGAYDRALERLFAAPDREAAERARGELAEVRLRLAEVRARVHAASGRLTALEAPAPLDLAAAQRALPPGMVLLSYVVGAERSFLFAVGAGREVEVHELGVGREALAAEVERLRLLIDEGRGLPDAGALERAASRLGARLLGPAAGAIARSERLLILPDGPLHALPFAALALPPAAPDAPFRYLAEARASSVAASATLFAALRGSGRRPARPLRLVAFGDPLPADPGGEPALRRPAPLPPLPSTRAEVEGVAAVFAGAAEVHLGQEASEERARAAAGVATHLHFAAHGWLDEASPLDSAVVLSRPAAGGGESANGLLQAWEVFEDLRLDADLVVLSGCATGLGGEGGGEGLLGLTRAFQYAGAESLLVSLWAIDDARTAPLMHRFYRLLSAGVPPDEALRRAQADFADLPAEAGGHPYFWAAFQLIGGAGGPSSPVGR